MSFVSRLSQHKNVLIPVAIGSVAVAAAIAHSATFQPLRNESSVAFKNDGQWTDLKLVKFEQLSHDSRRFTFALPSEDNVSGLTIASMLMAKFVTEKGNNVIRPYTPVSDPDQKGTIDFVVKHYPGGKFTTHLFGLKENDTVSFKGPIVKFPLGTNQFQTITLIGGGTGINPLYQLLRAITRNPEDKTKIQLAYGSKSIDDILLKKEIDEIAEKYPDQVQVTYFLDEEPKDKKEKKAVTGFISKDWLKEHIPGPDEKHHVFVCGPDGLMKAVSGQKISPSDQGELVGALNELGFKKEDVFKF